MKETLHMVSIDGQPLFYRELGTGSPLVLIHGYGVSGYIWQPTLPYLARQHQVLVLDLPGYGRTPMRGRWQLRSLAPLIINWLRILNIGPVALAGQSMGGAIALHVASCAPELVSHLALISSAGLPLQAGLSELANRSLRSLLQRGNGRFPPGLVRDALKPRLRVMWQGAYEMIGSDFRAEIATIQQPTLILWGEDDLLLPITLGRELHKALPHATFVSLPDCGHRPTVAKPEEVSRIMLEFLGTC